MPISIPRAVSAATIRRGLMLAERRRAHLVELYRSGRWRRYFTEQELVLRMRDAVHEVDVWSTAAARWDGAPEDERHEDERAVAGPPVDGHELPAEDADHAEPGSRHQEAVAVTGPRDVAAQAGSPVLLS